MFQRQQAKQSFRLLNEILHLAETRLFFLIILALAFLPAHAADTDTGMNLATNVSSVSATSMIQNIAKQLPSLMRLVTAISYVLGMFMIYHALMLLKQFGQDRTMMSSQHKLSGPVLAFVCGALLLYLPTSVQVGLSTFWAEPTPYGYITNQDQWSQFINNIYMIIQLFGTVALIRGLILLSHVGERGGGQQDALSKALLHVIGGLFCINIYQFIQVVLATLGVQTS